MSNADLNFLELLQLRSSLINYEINAEELQVEKELGEGFFGKVYKGTFRGKDVAIKKLTRTHFRDSSQLDLFNKEVSIISKLQHPCCVLFIGICSDLVNRCMVTEFVSGGSLRDFLDSENNTIEKFSYQARICIALEIAEGMSYLHSWKPNPIIHRDLTSMNILLQNCPPSHGFSFKAKLADFGLSKELNQEGVMTAAMGSLATMAPEVFRGESYTEKVDVYSYALLLVELLTNLKPHKEADQHRVAFLAAMEDYRPPLTGVPIEFAKLIQECWAPKPDSRPSFQQIVQYINTTFGASSNFSTTPPNPLNLEINPSSSTSTTTTPPFHSISNYNSGNSEMIFSPTTPSTRKGIYYGYPDSTRATIFSPPISNQCPCLTSSSLFSCPKISDVGSKTFTQHTGPVLSIRIVENLIGPVFLSCSTDCTARAWDFNSGINAKTYAGHRDFVNCVESTSINGLNVLATGCKDGTIGIWQIEDENCRRVIGEPGLNGINNLGWFQNFLVAANSDSSIKVFDVNTGGLTTTLVGHSSSVNTIHLDNFLLVSGGEDKQIKLWDTRTGKCFRSLFSNSGLRTVRMRSGVSDPVLGTGDSSGTIKVWDMHSFMEIFTPQIPNISPSLIGGAWVAEITDSHFCGIKMAVSTIDGKIYIVNTQTGLVEHNIGDSGTKNERGVIGRNGITSVQINESGFLYSSMNSVIYFNRFSTPL